MPTELKMPALSPTMEEGTLAKWLVKEGDTVASGDILAEIETDKATMEFEAVDEGKIAKILIPEGSDGVKVGFRLDPGTTWSRSSTWPCHAFPGCQAVSFQHNGGLAGRNVVKGIVEFRHDKGPGLGRGDMIAQHELLGKIFAAFELSSYFTGPHHSNRSKGIRNICLGAGWAIFLTILAGIDIGAIGFIWIALGISQVLIWYLNQPKAGQPLAPQVEQQD